jgi:hypothetical protein
MTTIISRLYPDNRTATTIAGELRSAGFPAGQVHVVHPGADMAALLSGAQVPDATAAAYAAAASAGNAVVVARAEITPLGAALRAMEIMDSHPSIHVAGADPNAYVRQSARGDLYLSILEDHPRWFSSDIRPGSGLGPGLISRAFGMRMLSEHRTRRSVIEGGRFMSRAFWPQKLLSAHRDKRSAMSGTRYMSRWFWPMALTSRKGA